MNLHKNRLIDLDTFMPLFRKFNFKITMEQFNGLRKRKSFFGSVLF